MRYEKPKGVLRFDSIGYVRVTPRKDVVSQAGIETELPLQLFANLMRAVYHWTLDRIVPAEAINSINITSSSSLPKSG